MEIVSLMFTKFIDYHPGSGLVMLAVTAILYLAFKAGSFYAKTSIAVEKIPAMKELLEKIDRNLSALNNALVEKDVIKQSYHK